MIRKLTDWLDHRTGYRGMIHGMLFEHIPGGSRWRYVWGSTLVFTFIVQMITGFFLWMNYSPSSQTAWESVYYIQNHMWGGWLLRGIHHYTAQAMIVLLALHMLQIIIDGAYRAPREVNFWIGLILLQITLGLSLTGYLLPWDQKGYWATEVATNIMSSVPGVGPGIQRTIVGGTKYGHHTLTRFFAMHAGLLPVAMIAFIAFHVYVFRRHGIKAKEPVTRPAETFWVSQVLKDAIACLAVLMVVLILCLQGGFFHGWNDAGRLGADLGAPANPTEAYGAARPEWYFLFLFQFLKLPAFKGEAEFIGAVIIPGAVMLMLVLMPVVGRWKLGHRFNIAFISGLLLGALVLTVWAVIADRTNADFNVAVAQAKKDADRVRDLAREGIPPTGALTLMREDAYTQGPRLFASNCASCHRFGGHNGLGAIPDPKINTQSAPDLKDFASRGWLKEFLDPDKIATAKYFGGTKFKDGKMVKYVHTKVKNFDQPKKDMLDKAVAAISAEANLKSQLDQDAKDAAIIDEGRKILARNKEITCVDCHVFHKNEDGDGSGPDLTGYGSRAYLMKFISNPAHEDFYRDKNDRMPLFGEKKLLTEREIGLIVDWLRGEWYEPGQTPAVAKAPATQPVTKPATQVVR